MRDEVQMILTMVSEGKISAEDGRRLLEALGRARDPNLESVLAEVAAGRLTPDEAGARLQSGGRPTDGRDIPPASVPGRWLRVVVTDHGQKRVNIRLPMGLVNAGLKMARLAPGHRVQVNGHTMDIDWDELVEQVRTMGPGRVIEIDDDDDHVEVSVE